MKNTEAKLDSIPRFWPKRIFYGWMIVFISFWDSMLSAGIGSYGFGVFIRILSSSELGMGWSRAAISAVALIRMVTTMALAPLLGRYADRRNGPRILMVIGSLTAGIALLLMALMQELWHFYLLFGVVWGAAMTALGGMILGPAIVSKWFVRRRGRALAIATMGVSAGGVIAIPLTTAFITWFGWRLAWAALGVVMLSTILPLGLFAMRRSPEDVGLLPDGRSPTSITNTQNQSGSKDYNNQIAVQGSYTPRAAFKTRAFWVLIVADTLGAMSLTPVLIHQVAYIGDKGFGLGTAAAIGTMVAAFAAIGKLPWGILAEKIQVRFAMGIAFFSAGISLTLIIIGDTLPMLYAYAIFFGFTMGSAPPLRNVAWASYFGRDNLGAIRGFATPLTRWAGGLSPLFAGLVYDLAGSYDVAFMVFAICWSASGVVVLAAGDPKEPIDEPQALGLSSKSAR